MKRGYIAILAMLCVVSCSDNEGEYDQMLQRAEEIKEDQAAMEQTISELQQYKRELDSRLASCDSITSVKRFENINSKSGYVISFKFTDPIYIYDGANGVDGKPGENGADGENIEPGENGEDGLKGPTGDDGADAIIKCFEYEEGDETVTIKLYDPTAKKLVNYTFPLDGSSIVVPGPVAFTLGSGEVAALTSDDNAVAINLPEDFAAEDYDSIVAEVLSSVGNGTSAAISRIGVGRVSVYITEPTFDDEGVYENNAAVEIDCWGGMPVDTPAKGVLTVTLTTKDGYSSSATIDFTYESLEQ